MTDNNLDKKNNLDLSEIQRAFSLQADGAGHLKNKFVTLSKLLKAIKMFSKEFGFNFYFKDSEITLLGERYILTITAVVYSKDGSFSCKSSQIINIKPDGVVTGKDGKPKQQDFTIEVGKTTTYLKRYLISQIFLVDVSETDSELYSDLFTQYDKYTYTKDCYGEPKQSKDGTTYYVQKGNILLTKSTEFEEGDTFYYVNEKNDSQIYEYKKIEEKEINL